MRKERKIINTNIRLNLCDEQDRQAWSCKNERKSSKIFFSSSFSFIMIISPMVSPPGHLSKRPLSIS